MTVNFPIKILNAVILVKIPYTGPSCIPFIHWLAVDDFSYKCCIFGVSEGHYDRPHNAISVFLVCIPCSSATFGSKEILPVSLKINAFLNRPNISRRKAFALSDRLCRFSIVTASENPFFHDQHLSLKLSKTNARLLRSSLYQVTTRWVSAHRREHSTFPNSAQPSQLTFSTGTPLRCLSQMRIPSQHLQRRAPLSCNTQRLG